VRLQKFLAECGIGSRRKMERFIIEGRVRVNGNVVTKLGSKVDPDVDRIEVNRRPVHAAPKGVVLFNKPRGVVSTLSDPEGRPSVADYLTKHYQSYFPVGRLDWDSNGLMVLTNDGELAEVLMHPRYGLERVYQVRVEGAVPEQQLQKIEQGVKLSDGVVRAVASIMRNDEKSTWVEVRIHEGRNRVVRRIFDKLGFPVMKLKRVVYGPFKLGSLQGGQLRPLTHKEYEQARRKVFAIANNKSSGEPRGSDPAERPVSVAFRKERGPSKKRFGSDRGAKQGAKEGRPGRSDYRRRTGGGKPRKRRG
jgi:23S rRNA pseudouridine2605 synthase